MSGGAGDRDAFKRAMDASMDGLAILDDEGKYVYVNDAHARVYGFDSEAEMVGMSWRELYDDDQLAQFESTVMPALGEAGEWRGEAVGHRIDGTTFPQELSLTTLPDGGLVCVVRDVSERKAHEARIETLNEAHHRLAYAETPAAVAAITVDVADRVLEHPLSAFWVHDRESDTLVPEAMTDEVKAVVGREEPLPMERGTLEMRVFESGEARFVEDWTTVEDATDPDVPLASYLMIPIGEHGLLTIGWTTAAELTPLDHSLFEVLAGDAAAALDRAVRDRLLREREAELARQNERLEAFASMVSHDLRNPLTVAMGNVDLVRETGHMDRLDAVDRALDRMNRLIGGFLTLAREGRTVNEPRPVSLESTATSAWQYVSTDGADLEVVGDAMVLADPERLSTLFENLFRNAVEHGSTGRRDSPDDAVEHGSTGDRAGAAGDRAGPGVRITVEPADGGFRVADDGPGFPAGERDQVFEAGYSGAGGTGLGLAIVREVAEAHGWSVSVDPDTPGATVVFTGVELAP